MTTPDDDADAAPPPPTAPAPVLLPGGRVEMRVDPARGRHLVAAVDMRAGGDARQAGIVLNATAVAGWTPIEGDDQAGFASCNKLALGSRVSLALDAGDAALFTVTLYDDA